MKKQGHYIIKDFDFEKRIVDFAFVNFDSYDSDNDLTKEGAFKKTFEEWGPNGKDRIAHLWNHERKLLPPIGKVQRLWEDKEGGYASSKILNSQLANDVLDAYKGGAVKEHSYWGKGVNVGKNELGGLLIKEVKLYEVSSVIWGSQENARLIKGLENGVEDVEGLKDHLNNVAKWVRKSSASDEFLQDIEIEILKTLDLLETLEKDEPSKDTQKREPLKLTLADIYKLKSH
jgi:uncharacterized protein